MPKKVIIIGNGAREHVIAETLRRSPQSPEVFTFGTAKNPGLVALSSGYELGAGTDFEALRSFVKYVEPDFVIPGPEAPIAAGVTDMLEEMGVRSVAPHKTVARLESSKAFTRDLLKKYEIPGNPKFKVFTTPEGLGDYMENELEGQFVVKADGLKGGKGVQVVGDHLKNVAEGVEYATECVLDAGQVVIEEKFVGQEFSLMSFADGHSIVDMVPVQDHKRAYEGDKGPNTGGMGTYSDANHLLPFLTEQNLADAHEITRQVLAALYEETGTRFVGIMYGGFIVTKNGVRLIEYNARFGDPEAMNCLSLLKTDFVDVCEAQLHGELAGMTIDFERQATVCKYVVPEGYPVASVKGEKIEIGPLPANVKTYFSSVDGRDDGLYLMGSRAVAFVGHGDSLEEAEKAAQLACEAVKGPVFYRKDIGTKALIDERIKMMEGLR
jgi:phosphoribosylamine---glycine ligase